MAVHPRTPVHRCIVAIGGGEVRKRETLAIDRRIVQLTRKKHPHFLFIPTASSDSPSYTRIMRAYYGTELGCETDVLNLLGTRPSQREMQAKIDAADIIYVGGGNTLKMMRRWRLLGVDRMLTKAYERGAILTGMSAGSICWFASGHSDSMSFYNPKHWRYINVRGLGLLPWVHCPHYNGRTRHLRRSSHFSRMIAAVGGCGIAIDNHCAIIFREGAYQVIASRPGAGAFVVERIRGQVIVRGIPQRSTFTSVAALRS